MNRAKPEDLRGTLELAHDMAKAGILFVPMPVVDRKEYVELMRHAIARMNQMEIAAEAAEAEETGGAA